MAAFLGRIADLGSTTDAAGDLDDLVVDATLDQHARRRIAGLAGIVEAFEHASAHSVFEIGIGKDDVR
ncbi:hypothetical protein D3C86_2034750 [compost metagenome]